MEKEFFPQNISYIRLLSWWPCCAMQLLSPISKTVDICAVDNVDKDNFAVAKGLVAHVCPEINNGSDLLKRMNEYANAGIAILRTDYENNDEDFDPSEYLE